MKKFLMALSIFASMAVATSAMAHETGTAHTHKKGKKGKKAGKEDAAKPMDAKGADAKAADTKAADAPAADPKPAADGMAK